ncbi:MAG TPA: DUF2336 domain-containing protein [Rhizomicrobium sp.]|jgi:uncharacterized protein (DUF2336 family)
MHRLAQLAMNPQATGRDDIYMAVASLYRSQGDMLSPRERMLMREILVRLTHDVEMAIRINLAEKLADDHDAPIDLILLLCDDRIEVARPIILRCRKLSDNDILKFVSDAGIAHQTACAERQNIGEPITAALARLDAEPVLIALVRNATARITAGTFETLVEKSRKVASIQEPLARRDDLPSLLATQMCGWVSDALKTYIVQNHRLTPEAVAKAVGRASQVVMEPLPKADFSESARKLVDKLAAGGQLKTGFLLRVLHQGQMDMFETAFAKLLDVDLPAMRHLLYANGARPVALACRAVGIDKCVFPTVFNLSHQARGYRPALSIIERQEIDNVFTTISKDDALTRLKSVELFYTPVPAG